MLSPEEILVLESLLARARQVLPSESACADIRAGDIVQLRPGADSHWKTSFLHVGKVRHDGGIAGTLLRPHRGGWREAWYTFRPPELYFVGSAPFPEPRVGIGGDLPLCPACHNLERKPVGRETGKPAKLAKKAGSS